MDLVEFQDGDRTFTCRAASSPATPGTLWWWVSVTGESQRYAAFRTQDDDTPPNLRPRILAYYAQLLADRARPREVRSHWAQRRPAQKPAEPAERTEGAVAESNDEA
jgi:hypothetical protein